MTGRWPGPARVVRAAAGGLAALLLACGLVWPATASAQPQQPPARCSQATLVEQPPEAVAAAGVMPVLLVHGFIDDPGLWSKRIDHSTLTSEPPDLIHSTVQDGLRHLPGVAVYTLDYRSVNTHWFTQPGAGGEMFVDAVDCLLQAEAFAGRNLAVVAHSMGGLIARWALTAQGADSRAERVGPVVTLGTPYAGSWLAGFSHDVLDAVPGFELLSQVVHLLLVGCRNVPADGCGQLRQILEFFAATEAFVPGSPQLEELPPWPDPVPVYALASRVVVEDIPRSFFFSGMTSLTVDLGDGVVSVDSATVGNHEPPIVPECRYTASASRTAIDQLLVTIGQRAAVDTPRSLVSMLFGGAVCGHTGQTRLIQLTNQILGIIADTAAASVAPDCIALSEVETDGVRLLTEAGVEPAPAFTAVHDPQQITCVDNWALIEDVEAYANRENVQSRYFYLYGPVLVRWESGQWVGVSAFMHPFDCGIDAFCQQPATNPDQCAQAPAVFRAEMEC